MDRFLGPTTYPWSLGIEGVDVFSSHNTPGHSRCQVMQLSFEYLSFKNPLVLMF